MTKTPVNGTLTLAPDDRTPVTVPYGTPARTAGEKSMLPLKVPVMSATSGASTAFGLIGSGPRIAKVPLMDPSPVARSTVLLPVMVTVHTGPLSRMSPR